MEKVYCGALDWELPRIAYSELFEYANGSTVEHRRYVLYLDNGSLVVVAEYATTSGGRCSSVWNTFECVQGTVSSIQEFYDSYVFPARRRKEGGL